MSLRVGFLSPQLDNRGTGNAMYDYARFNKSLLGNESQIFTFRGGDHAKGMVEKYSKEFGNITYLNHPGDVGYITGIDVLYHIKYGNNEGIETSTDVRYAVHSVFTNTPHGDRYATVSKWLSGRTTTPYVPHIINLPPIRKALNMREHFDIPSDAKVFGRYGAKNTFDIPWVWDVMNEILEVLPNVYFFFANTEPSLIHPRIIYARELVTPSEKVMFINSCDYMLHARSRGETFGIAVGEFSSKGKPIITYNLSGETAHLDILGSSGIGYSNGRELYSLLLNLSKAKILPTFKYTEFTPEIVMTKFRKVFLDE